LREDCASRELLRVVTPDGREASYVQTGKGRLRDLCVHIYLYFYFTKLDGGNMHFGGGNFVFCFV